MILGGILRMSTNSKVHKQSGNTEATAQDQGQGSQEDEPRREGLTKRHHHNRQAVQVLLELEEDAQVWGHHGVTPAELGDVAVVVLTEQGGGEDHLRPVPVRGTI